MCYAYLIGMPLYNIVVILIWLIDVCYTYPTPILAHYKNIVFLHSFFHFMEHNHKSASAHPLHRRIQLSLLYQSPSILSHPSPLLQSTHINHSLSQFFTSISHLSIQTTYIIRLNLLHKVPFRPAVILQAVLACSWMQDCIFLFKVGRCRPSQPSG